MKAIILMAVVGILSTNVSNAQIKNAKTETVKVFGNCGMCETTIEKAGSKSKFYKTDWDVDSKVATITYDSKQTSLDAALKSIALSGYDNVNYLAPDDAYDKLHSCCKYERESKTIAKTESHESMPNHDNKPNGNDKQNMQQANQLKAVYESYFALKDALVKTDGLIASANASAMIVAIDAVDMAKLNTEEHTTWMTVEEKLKFDAQHIKENKEPQHQRDHFTSLSKNMYDLIKVAKPVETIYYQYCPMANDGKGANWLSKESAIKNPYYGSQMLSCGKTVETIKQ